MKCYCKERKGHWYFRMRVPKELHPYLPSEISNSIKGLDLETARFSESINRHRNRFLAIRSHYSDDVLITNESYRSIQFNR